MHILFITDNFPPEVNAVASRVYERACYWVRWGHQVTVITCAPNFPQGKLYSGYQNRWYQIEKMDGIKVVRVKTFIVANEGFLLRMLDFISFMLSGFGAGLFQRKMDVVVATSPQFFSGICGWMLSFFRRKPYILEIGDLWPASIAAVGLMSKQSAVYHFLEKIELAMYRFAKLVIVQTQAFKKDIVDRGIDSEKLVTVMNGVDLTRYMYRPKDEDLLSTLHLRDKFVVGYMGTMGSAHDLINVIETATLLQQQPKIHFLFVGGGAEKKSLQSLTAARNLGNITFVDFQPKTQMPRYWSICDVSLVHLKNDPLFATVVPSKLFESVAMGLPVVLVAPEGEATQLLDEHRFGVKVSAGQPHALAQTLQMQLAEGVREYHEHCLSIAPLFSREKQAQLIIEAIAKATMDFYR